MTEKITETIQILKDEEQNLIEQLETSKRNFVAFLQAKNDGEGYASALISEARLLTDKVAQLSKVRQMISRIEKIGV